MFEPLGFVLRPEVGAISMSGSSIIVAVNAVALKRLPLPRRRGDDSAHDLGAMSSTGKSAAVAVSGVAAAALWWRRNPSACPYGQRFRVEVPHPFEASPATDPERQLR